MYIENLLEYLIKNNYIRNINTFTYYSEAIVMHDSI